MKNLKSILLAFTMILTLSIFGQEKIITGIIRDNRGDYIAGARIQIKGTRTETLSSFDGTYSIKVNEGDLLVFLWFGCKDIEMKVGSLNIINVMLLEAEPEFVYCTFGVTRENYDAWQLGTLGTAIEIYPIAIDKTITFDLENNFKDDIKNKTLKIYVLENKTNTISQSEFNFQHKYKTTFTTFYKISNEYFENYNKKVFNYLEDNFNDKWQNEINSDIIGFDSWQNN